MVDTLADLTPPELEHVAFFRRPLSWVSDSHMLEERAGPVVEHLSDDGPRQRDQSKSRSEHNFVGRRS